MSKRPMDYAVKDATRDLIVTITKRDISASARKQNDACAAAHALCRQEGFKEARVYKTKAYVKHSNGTWTRYTTPKDLYLEILIFDRGGEMQAGQFRLSAPAGSQKLGAHAKPTGKKKQTGKLPATPHIISNVRDDAPRGRNNLRALFE